MHDRVANLLGATALAITDLMLAGATRAAGASASGAAALLVLRAAPGLSVTELGRRVGLTQPAAARMVATLEASGLTSRRATPGRAVAVHLTAAGERSAARLLAARAAPLAEVLSDLDASQLVTLAGLLEPVLARLHGRTGSSELVCRLCDRDVCTTDAVCPVGEAARRATDQGGDTDHRAPETPADRAAQRDADREATDADDTADRAAGSRGDEAER